MKYTKIRSGFRLLSQEEVLAMKKRNPGIGQMFWKMKRGLFLDPLDPKETQGAELVRNSQPSVT